jgi:hypothetical protein
MMASPRGMKSVSVLISFLVLLNFVAGAQPVPAELRMIVVEGEGVSQPAGRRVERPPSLRVSDENNKPLSGVAVVFALPTEGATGEFADGAKTLVVVTDQDGIATANGLRLNNIPGKLVIHVNASYRRLSARTNITQHIVGGSGEKGGGGGRTGLIIAIVAIAGAAAGGGAYAMLRSKNGSSGSTPVPPVTPIGITPVTGTISPPR